MSDAEQLGASIGADASVTHTVTRRCEKCHAPGVFQPRGGPFDHFPAVCVALDDSRLNQPVGASCPHCGAERGAHLTEERGVVWRGKV